MKRKRKEDKEEEEKKKKKEEKDHLKGNELHRTYSLRPIIFMLIMMIKCKGLMHTVIKNIIYIHKKLKKLNLNYRRVLHNTTHTTKTVLSCN
jgi:hypothetical protein